jgi:hypothetical protein
MLEVKPAMHRSISAAASSFSNFSVRGAAARGATGGVASSRSAAVFGQPAISPGLASSSFSEFHIKGTVANSLSSHSPTSSYQPAFEQKSTIGGNTASMPTSTSSSSKMLSGFGHYSSQGVPAFTGVNENSNVDAIISGTQRRTPGTWSWSRDGR